MSHTADQVTLEEWRAVVGYEGLYEVSNLGRVKLMARDGWSNGTLLRLSGRILKPQPIHKGYVRVVLNGHGIRRFRRIHRLVLQAFVGECPDGMQCAHLNGDPADCQLSNLAWVSPTENASHKHAHGTHLHGSKSNLAVLDEAQVLDVLKLKGALSAAACARKYGVTPSTILLIWNRVTWKHVSAPSPIVVTPSPLKGPAMSKSKTLSEAQIDRLLAEVEQDNFYSDSDDFFGLQRIRVDGFDDGEWVDVQTLKAVREIGAML